MTDPELTASRFSIYPAICPQCGANYDERCKEPDGTERAEPHAARQELDAQIAREEGDPSSHRPRKRGEPYVVSGELLAKDTSKPDLK